MNRLFLVAVTGECCLNILTGMTMPYGSPFKLARQQFAKAGVVIPGNGKAAVLIQLKHTFLENGMEPHKLLQKAIDHLSVQLGKPIE